MAESMRRSKLNYIILLFTLLWLAACVDEKIPQKEVIKHVNNAPTAYGERISTNAGSPIRVNLIASDPENDSISFEIVEAPSRVEYDEQEKNVDASRPVGTSKTRTGIISVEIEDGRKWRYFQIGPMKYKITHCYKSCEQELFKCKSGEECAIQAEFGKEHTIVAKTLRVIGEIKTTDPGNARFTRVSEEALTKLGVYAKKCGEEAWREPDVVLPSGEIKKGKIWCDIAMKKDKSPRFMKQTDAEAYCKGIGAELPTGWREEQNGKFGFKNEDSDFVRLTKYMGAKSGSNEGYEPQVLPNLTYTKNGQTRSRYFWSSSSVPFVNSISAYVFSGHNGDIYFDYRYHSNFYLVLCVV